MVGPDPTFLCFSSGPLGNLWELCVHHVWALSSNFEQWGVGGPHSFGLIGGTQPDSQLGCASRCSTFCVFVALRDWAPQSGNHSTHGL